MTAVSQNSGLPTAVASRDNCFDLLRLLLAGLVVYSHTYQVGGHGEEGLSRFAHGQTIAGTVAVLGFFGLSGFLVGDSFVRSPDWLQFLRRRVRRIMPGFWACMIVTGVVLAPAMYWLQHHSLAGYAWTGPDSAVTYVLHNVALRMHQWGIGDVLAGAAYPGSLNGSLWSLFPEFWCYLVLLFAGMCGLMNAGRLWLLIFTGVLAVFHLFVAVKPVLPPYLLPTLVTLLPFGPYVLAFFVGAACRAYLEHIPAGAGAAVFFGVLAVVLLRLGGYQLAAPVIVPLALLSVGRSFTVRLRHDFSYGLYIYAFPCQQVLALVPGLRNSIVAYFVASLALSLAFAAASWFWVERRFLGRQPGHSDLKSK